MSSKRETLSGLPSPGGIDIFLGSQTGFLPSIGHQDQDAQSTEDLDAFLGPNAYVSSDDDANLPLAQLLPTSPAEGAPMNATQEMQQSDAGLALVTSGLLVTTGTLSRPRRFLAAILTPSFIRLSTVCWSCSKNHDFLPAKICF